MLINVHHRESYSWSLVEYQTSREKVIMWRHHCQSFCTPVQNNQGIADESSTSFVLIKPDLTVLGDMVDDGPKKSPDLTGRSRSRSNPAYRLLFLQHVYDKINGAIKIPSVLSSVSTSHVWRQRRDRRPLCSGGTFGNSTVRRVTNLVWLRRALGSNKRSPGLAATLHCLRN